MPNEYTIRHISDVLNVPPEDADEVFADLRAAYDIAYATRQITEALDDESDLAAFMPEVRSVCDGLQKHKVDLRVQP